MPNHEEMAESGHGQDTSERRPEEPEQVDDSDEGDVDAFELITRDHRTVEELFTRFESMPSQDANAAERKRLVDQIVHELSVHASVEEQVLYPAVRKALEQGEGVAEESLEDHQLVKEALRELEKMSPSDEGYDDRVIALIDEVREHATEEEEVILPQLREKLGDEEMLALGKSMRRAKMVAPTHPHPMAPNTPPGNIVAGAVAAVVDRVRDIRKSDDE